MNFFSLATDHARLEEKDYERVDEDTTWDDLYTDLSPFEEEFKRIHDYSIWGFLDELEEPIGLPKIIPMFGFFDLLPKTEMPVNNLSWTIVSKNFLKVVQDLGFTDFRLIPIRVIDREFFDNFYREDVRLYISDDYIDDIPHDDDWFFGFQVLSRVQILAKGERPPKLYNDPVLFDSNLDKIVIPHFFKDINFTSRLFVSEEAKKALEEAGIRGLQFTEPFRLY